MIRSAALLTASLLAASAYSAEAYQPTAAERAFPETEKAAEGPFQPTWESLKTYQTPQWFRDAKFGIWAHWGPQCQPEMGDWYARFMYLGENKTPWARLLLPFHTARYGHPSKFGFKDVIHIWWADRWDPEKLMALYKRAGAQYFMALANHHDNFDLFDSKYQPWNSTKLGPKRDIVGEWAKAARGAGLRFGVSVHASHAWSWYETAQGADSSGSFANLPYDGKLTAADGKGQWWDGLDPQDLYAQNHPVSNAEWEWQIKPEPADANDPRRPSAPYVNKYFNRTVDLINKYNPDFIYFDDTVLPFYPINDTGLRLAAHFYNSSIARNKGHLEAVIYGKKLDAEQRKAMVYDIERGKAADILPLPWQTDTCIGSWHYDRRLYEKHEYKKAPDVIRMLIDVVSKNGNLMLSVPLRGDGTPDDDELEVLSQIATWMEVNRVGIFGTRPWKIYGEGPSSKTVEKGQFDGIKDVNTFTAEDIRYTEKQGILYAFVMGWPSNGEVVLPALAEGSAHYPGKIRSVRLIGSKSKITTKRDGTGLHVTLPPTPPAGTPTTAFLLEIKGQ